MTFLKATNVNLIEEEGDVTTLESEETNEDSVDEDIEDPSMVKSSL